MIVFSYLNIYISVYCKNGVAGVALPKKLIFMGFFASH